MGLALRVWIAFVADEGSGRRWRYIENKEVEGEHLIDRGNETRCEIGGLDVGAK